MTKQEVISIQSRDLKAPVKGKKFDNYCLKLLVPAFRSLAKHKTVKQLKSFRQNSLLLGVNFNQILVNRGLYSLRSIAQGVAVVKMTNHT
jgi:hypothetical protein